VPVEVCALLYLSACTRVRLTLPQCLYKGDLYLYLFTLLNNSQKNKLSHFYCGFSCECEVAGVLGTRAVRNLAVLLLHLTLYHLQHSPYIFTDPKEQQFTISSR